METAITQNDMHVLEESLAHIQKDVEAISYTLTLLKQKTVSISIDSQLQEQIDPKLASLLGTQPKLSLREEKRIIREIVAKRFTR